eukprot:GFKZ01003212.1.p2 GENE.GFKZ01003212.1~~GFKZ01003212.1.p2  ORF type:complete len:126 (+),score=4.06 GFKZ01003212.1:173-550(+)
MGRVSGASRGVGGLGDDRGLEGTHRGDVPGGWAMWRKDIWGWAVNEEVSGPKFSAVNLIQEGTFVFLATLRPPHPYSCSGPAILKTFNGHATNSFFIELSWSFVQSPSSSLVTLPVRHSIGFGSW